MADVLEGGAVVWRERRTRPLVALFWLPAAFLAIVAFSIAGWGLQLVAAAGAVAFGVFGWRARRRALIETYTLTDLEVVVQRPDEPDESMPLAAVQRATMVGDKVRFETGEGRSLTLGFVQRQRSLMRTLERVAPTVVIDRKIDAFCRT